MMSFLKKHIRDHQRNRSASAPTVVNRFSGRLYLHIMSKESGRELMLSKWEIRALKKSWPLFMDRISLVKELFESMFDLYPELPAVFGLEMTTIETYTLGSRNHSVEINCEDGANWNYRPAQDNSAFVLTGPSSPTETSVMDNNSLGQGVPGGSECSSGKQRLKSKFTKSPFVVRSKESISRVMMTRRRTCPSIPDHHVPSGFPRQNPKYLAVPSMEHHLTTTVKKSASERNLVDKEKFFSHCELFLNFWENVFSMLMGISSMDSSKLPGPTGLEKERLVLYLRTIGSYHCYMPEARFPAQYWLSLKIKLMECINKRIEEFTSGGQGCAPWLRRQSNPMARRLSLDETTLMEAYYKLFSFVFSEMKHSFHKTTATRATSRSPSINHDAFAGSMQDLGADKAVLNCTGRNTNEKTHEPEE